MPDMGEQSLLVLLQIADSAFPVGGYAYSHGLEWLVHAGVVQDEVAVAALLDGYVAQVVAGQWLPAASAAWLADTSAAVLASDDRLDASIALETERLASRAIGERLLAGAAEVFPGPRAAGLLTAIRTGQTPGHYAIAFAAIARDADVPRSAMTSALGYTMIGSVTQAAVRLGVIGQAAAMRCVATACARLPAAVPPADHRRRPIVGAFTPGLDVAAALQPQLPFRMFAS